MSQSKSKSSSNLIKCRGLGIRYSRMFFVTKENFSAYIQACKRNQVWSGATEIEESIEDHIVKQDVRISLYLRKIEIRLHPDNPDVIQVAIKSGYKIPDLYRDMKHQSQVKWDCMEKLRLTQTKSVTGLPKNGFGVKENPFENPKQILNLYIEPGTWLIVGSPTTYVSAQSLIAAYEAWDLVDMMEPKPLLHKCLALNNALNNYEGHPYYNALLPKFKAKQSRLTISEAAVLQNIYCFLTLHTAGQSQLKYERDLEIERSTSYVYNPVRHTA